MLDSQHFQEWRDSSVDPDIIRLNVKSLNEALSYEYLIYSPQVPRRNDGRVTDHILNRYRHTEQGGWWCSGLDPLSNWQPMLWGCFKPDRPKRDSDGKLIKYEHPPRTQTRAFFLSVPLQVWYKTAKRHGVKMPENIHITPDGEAVGFWAWVVENQIPVIFVEGCKKAGALLTAGYAASAVPGITNGYRCEKDDSGKTIKRHLIPELQVFAGCHIFICFDNDTKQKTIQNVNNAIATLGELFNKAGSEVSVIKWTSPEKGVDDYIAAHGEIAFEHCYNESLSLDGWKCRQYSALNYVASYSLCRRYLGEIPIPENAKLICLKAPKGTGKTESIAKIVSDVLAKNQWVIILTHRVQLGEALCKRFGVPYVTELRECQTGKLFGFGLCVDSLHPKSQAQFSAENWTDGTVIIDECEQLFWHLLNAKTECETYRVSIFKELKKLLTNVLTSNQGKIILSDADLSDLSIQYVQKLTGIQIEPWIAVNDWKPEQGWNVYNYGDKDPAAMVLALEKHIEAGSKPFICCSGQKKKSKWGTQNLESHLRQKYPHLRILRIDSVSVADPTHPAYGCIGSLNEILTNYDIVIASPSIETGVSIDIKNRFTSVWGIFQGVTSENSARQALARVREPIDRHIWVAKYGIGKIGNGATSTKSLLSSQHKLTKRNIQLLQNADLDFETLDATFDLASLSAWAKMACRINQGMIRYRDSVLYGLIAEGHSIIELNSDEPSSEVDELKEEITALRDANHQQEAFEISLCPDIAQPQYEELQKKKEKTVFERQQERKHSLLLRYGMDVKPDLVLKDDDGWHPRIQMHYYLTAGRDFLEMRDSKRIEGLREQGSGQGRDGKDALWMPDFNRSQLSAAVKMLEDLQALMLMNLEREFRATDPDLIQMAELAKANQWRIKACLGVTIKETDTPIAIAQKILKLLGLKFTCTKREGARGNRVRVYKFIASQDGRDEVFAAWLERDRTALSEWLVVSSCPSVSRVGNKEDITQPLDTKHLDTDILDADILDAVAAVEDEIADLDSDPSHIEGGAELLAMSIEDGAEAIKALLAPWQPEKRWAVVLKLEERCGGYVTRLLEVVPDVFKWLNVLPVSPTAG